MRRLAVYFYLLLASPGVLLGEEWMQFSWNNLDQHQDQYQDQKVILKGFLYQTPDGQWIAASKPDIKSCCLPKVSQQVVLQGNFSGLNRTDAVSIKGRFHISFVSDSFGNLKPAYELTEAVLVSEGNTRKPWLSLVLAGALLSLTALYLKKKRS